VTRAAPPRTAGLALLPALAFVIAAPLHAFAAGAAGALLDRAVMHSMVETLDLSRRARGLAVQLWFQQNLATAGVFLPGHLLDPPAHTWEAVAEGLLPPDWLAAQAHGAVDAFYDWLAGEDQLPDLQFDLRPVRERLQSPAGAAALLPLLADARPCLPEEAPLAEHAAATGAGVFVPCLPPGANLEALARATANRTAQQMPPVLDVPALARSGALAPETLAQLLQARRWARWVEALLRLWFNFCLLLLVLNALASARTWAGLLASPAPPLAVAGVVTLLFAPLVYGMALAAGPQAALEPVETSGLLAFDAAGYVGRAAALRLAGWGAGMLALALAGWGAARRAAR
jgi:hypothetical protein